MAPIVSFFEKTRKDVHAGYESWRILTLASAGSLVITVFYIDLFTR